MRGKTAYLAVILLSISLAILNIGCSNNLTKDRAREAISAAKKYPLKKIVHLEISGSGGRGVLITKEKMPDYIKMMAEKLITMNIRNISNSGGEYYEVKLTAAGKKYVLKQRQIGDRLDVEVLLGEIIFDRIISIRKENDRQVYTVNYLEELSRITPFGTCLIKKPIYEKTARLALHQGKWQIAAGTGLAK
jgi:hypothetical protein